MINIIIDELTNCLEVRQTGEIVDTYYKERRKKFTDKEIARMHAEGWSLMKTMSKRKNAYDFEEVITSGVVYSGEHKPFKLREALKLIEKLGRPLNDEEMKQFEY